MPTKITVTRKQLFDCLWDKGYEQSAEFFGVSLNELTDIYKRYNIPEPTPKYFADRHAGNPVKMPELPYDGNEEIELQTVWKRRQKIDSTLGSKANAICILQTLEDYSDTSKALSVLDIIRLMDENYRIKVDRRTVYTTIEMLIDLGYDIDIDKQGSKNYYALNDKILEPSEVKILMDSLALNPLLSYKLGDEISNKINKFLAKRTPLQRTWYWHTLLNNTKKNDDVGDLLYAVLDEIDAAIMQKKKIEFTYLKYDLNGSKVPYREEKYIVSPYMIELRDNMYNLNCCLDDGNVYVRVRLDRMADVRMLDESSTGKSIAGYHASIEDIESSDNDKKGFLSITTLKCDKSLIDKVTTDFLGNIKQLDLQDNKDGTFNFTHIGNMFDIAEWALSVCDKCEIVDPPEAREYIINKIKNNKYKI